MQTAKDAQSDQSSLDAHAILFVSSCAGSYEKGEEPKQSAHPGA